MKGKTHFHTLGITPAALPHEIAKAYREQVQALFGRPEWDICTSMYQAEQTRQIATLTEAFNAIVNGDVRKKYIKKLLAACMICPLCGGRGHIKVDDGFKSIPCIACGGTGWATEYSK